MDCVNHPGVSATAYCQNCGKPMCTACMRQEAGGQVLCEPCWTAWQSARAPFAVPPPGAPVPGLAALLGIIPGVGAMYNGQFVKGFIHVAIFAVLVSMSSHYGIFGLFIAAWILYQIFDAYQTARARRDGEPLPDLLGMNELASFIHAEVQAQYRSHPGAAVPPAQPGAGAAQGQQPAGAPYGNAYRSGYQPPPFTGAPPAPGFVPPAGGFAPPPAGYGPPPPPPPAQWRRPEPVAAIILIGMGVLFLLGQVGWFTGRMFEFAWPVLLIGVGAWLLVRRLQEPPPPAAFGNGIGPAAPPAANPENKPGSGNEPQEGSL